MQEVWGIKCWVYVFAWSCPGIVDFWRAIRRELCKMLAYVVPVSPLNMLLRYVADVPKPVRGINAILILLVKRRVAVG